MKIIALGDTHGRSLWKEITAKEENADKTVFIGDYFDSRNGHSANRQIENFKDILAFKRANPSKVVMLIGNHDFHYMKAAKEAYSGYQQKYAEDIQVVLEDAMSDDSLQMCYKEGDFFFSHAGLSETWLRQSFSFAPHDPISLDNLEQSINDLFKHKPYYFRFNMGTNLDPSGDDVCQSPIWIRPQSLASDMFKGIRCVVGHTTVVQLGLNEKFPNLILIDTLGTSEEYLVIENGTPRVAK